MSWGKSRTILRLLSLSRNRHRPDIRGIATRRRDLWPPRRNEDSRALGSSLIHHVPPGRRSWSSSAFFSTAPSAEFSDEEDGYDETLRENPSARKRGRRKDVPGTSITSMNTDYEESTIDRIVSSGIGEYQSLDVDTAVTEGYLQRLVDDHISNKSKIPPNPNMLLNMLELMHNEDTHLSNDTVLKIFREVVRSKRVKLLERAEDVVVKNRYDPRLLRMLVTGYLNAGAPRKAYQLLMEWPTESMLHQPGIESYRRVLAGLGEARNRPKRTRPAPSERNRRRRNGEGRKPDRGTTDNSHCSDDDTDAQSDDEKNYLHAHQLLQHMCRTHAKFPELSLAPDRDCFHEALGSCSSIGSLSTAKGILEDMQRFATSPERPLDADLETTGRNNGIRMPAALDTMPNASTIRVFVNAWVGNKGNRNEATDAHEEAFGFLRRIEEETLTWPTDNGSQPIVDIDCYNVLLNVPAELGRFELAEKLFLRLMMDYLKGDRSNVQPDEVTLNTVLKSHVKANTEPAAVSAEAFLDRLDHFFEQQRRLQKKKQGCPDPPRVVHDIQPTARARSTISNLWIKLRQPEKAIEVLSKAESVYREKEEKLASFREHYPNNSHMYRTDSIKQFKPDKITYRQIIGALSKLEDPPTAALAMKAEEIAERKFQMGHRLNLRTSNTILNCWAKAGQPERAERFLEDEMVERYQVIPDIVSYNTIIHGYARLGNLDRALELLTRLLEDSLSGQAQSRRYPKPNARTFTNIVVALSKEHSIEAAEEAERLLLKMQELNDAPYNLNTRPNNITYNAVMNCWASLSLPSSIRERRYKLQHQEKLKNGKAKKESNVQGDGVCDNKNEHHRFGRKAEFVLRSMQGLGADEMPSAISYNIVIRAYSNDMVKAEKLLRDMIANGLEPTEHTFNTLVHVLNRDFRIVDKEKKLEELKQNYFSSLQFAARDRSPSHRNRKVTLK